MSGPPVKPGQRLPVAAITGLVTFVIVGLLLSVIGLVGLAWLVAGAAGVAMGWYVAHDIPVQPTTDGGTAWHVPASPPSRHDTRTPMPDDASFKDLLYGLWVRDAEDFDTSYSRRTHTASLWASGSSGRTRRWPWR